MATDQEIRDAGFKYVPQQQYLLNPFELPENQEPVVNQGIVNTNAFTGGGGDDFSVYNPDPNSIVNRDYRPNYDYRQFSEYGSDPSTADIKQMDMNQNYFYEPPPSKLEGLMGMIPYVGSFVRGANFLSNQISPYLPVNRRAILENELGGKGIMVNNIGQIVQGEGDYNTAENIMAGYNPYHMTAKTFDDRIEMATKKMTPGEYKDKRIAALKEAKTNFLGAQSKTDKIYDFEEDEKEKKKKDTIVGRFLTEKKEKQQIELQKEIDAANLKAAQDAQAAGGPSYRNIASGDMGSDGQTPGGRKGNVTTTGGDTYGGEAYGYNEAAEKTDFYARGGRAGYFYGGRVNFKNGGLASIL